MFNGNGVSAGVAIAPVIVYEKKTIAVPQTPAADIDAELDAFARAHGRMLDETDALIKKVRAECGEKEAAIFEAHRMLLDDVELTDPIRSGIKSGGNAAMAVDAVMTQLIGMFAGMDDAYFRERAADMADLRERLLRILLHIEVRDIASLGSPVILAAHELTPSDTARMDVKNIAGILTEIGGATSHSAIMARTLELPAVVGIAHLLSAVVEGELAAMDGKTGEVVLNPSEEDVVRFSQKLLANNRERASLAAMIGLRSETADGSHVEIFANIGTSADVSRVLENDAEGIGLFRSEFLYMDRDGLPSEQEQFEAYRTVLEAMKGKPVIVRTLDIGGDKELPALQLPVEQNPFLGLRAIRLCLTQTDLFKTQLRALLRASVYGNLRIMFPMICTLDELRAAKGLLQEAAAEIRAEGVPVAERIKTGIMVETPAAALLADALAAECDFFSIGTNDLTQYTLAVDRGNDAVAHLYSHLHPSVVRLIAQTISAAQKAGIICGMCGEAASDPAFVPLLLGLGLEEFSVSPGAVLRTRKLISKLSAKACRELAQSAMQRTTAGEVRSLLDAFTQERGY